MKRLMTVMAALALAIGAVGATAPAAFASASTCTTHLVDNAFGTTPVYGWDSNGNYSTSAWTEFKCGGSNNESFRVTTTLQVYSSRTGSWVTENCVSGGCSSTRPTSGYFAGGTDYNRDVNFNLLGSLSGKTVRFVANVDFGGSSPSLFYKGTAYTW